MPGVGLADVESLGGLREMFSSDRKFIQNFNSSLYGNIRKASEREVNFNGDVFSVEVLTSVNESYAAINSRQQLPLPQMQSQMKAQYKPKLMYSALEFETIAGEKGGNGGRGSGKFRDDYTKGTLMSFMSNISIDLYGAGFGQRGKVTAATPGAASFTVQTTQWIRPNMVLDWYDPTLAVKRGQVKIGTRGIDPILKTPYLDASTLVPAGAGANDRLFVADSLTNAPATGKHMQGLLAIIDGSNALGGISPLTHAGWQAPVQSAAGANATESLLQAEWDILTQISGTMPDWMIFHPSQKRAYLQPFLAQRRYTSNNFDTGAASLSFTPTVMGNDSKSQKPRNMSMLEDIQCPIDTWFMLDSDAVALSPFYTREPSLAAEDGKEFRLYKDYDTLSGFMRYWAELVTFKRNAVGAITNLAIPASAI